jgi:hypothetical protein
MQCANCGATIAEKAIVCYRCGAPTALPVRPPKPQPPASRVPWVVVAVVVAATVIALGIWYFTTCCGS